jgi:hypothetical protein
MLCSTDFFFFFSSFTLTSPELDPRSRVTESTAYQAVSGVRQYDGSYHSYK